MAALAAVIMLLSYFPYFTYSIPAVSGLMIMAVVIELDKKWAAGAYLVSGLLAFLFAEPEAKLLYICLFGFYPILKAGIEKIGKPAVEWVLKLIVFNIAVLAVYRLLAGIFGVSTEEFGEFGKYGAGIFLAAANIVFVLYDIAVSRMALFYMARLHHMVSKFLK